MRVFLFAPRNIQDPDVKVSSPPCGRPPVSRRARSLTKIQNLKQRKDLSSQGLLDQPRLKQGELTTKNKRETIYVAA